MPSPGHAQNSLISPAGKHTTVTLACNPFPPSKISEMASEPGYDVEILRAAFATRNITLITPFYPWKRAYFLAKTGQVDGLCSCSYLPEREKDFLFSDLLGRVRIAVYATQQEILDAVNTVEDARNMTIGIVNGYSLEAIARDAGLDVITANSEATLINLLLSRRLDAVLSFKSPIDYLIKHSDDTTPDMSSVKTKIAANNPYYSCITKNIDGSEALMAQFNLGLQTIRENGLYEKILAKYGTTPEADTLSPDQIQ
ncbi:substrate-binding periplasmic protein [Thalassospira lucentensis]|uniref:substrate-binding periplasmic protein n=1 Tax=Thalassospira lucentensis TaxID=168935 RepID=UPI003D2F4249